MEKVRAEVAVFRKPTPSAIKVKRAARTAMMALCFTYEERPSGALVMDSSGDICGGTPKAELKRAPAS